MACMVRGCRSRSSRQQKGGEKISFHRFPSNYDFKKIWIRALGREDHWEPKERRICSIHFTADSFSSTHPYRKLKDNTVPKLHLYFQNMSWLEEDLENYMYWKMMKGKAILKSTAKLRNISSCSLNTRDIQQENLPLSSNATFKNAEDNTPTMSAKSQLQCLEPQISRLVGSQQDDANQTCRVCLGDIKQNARCHDIFQKWTPPFYLHSTTIALEISKLANVQLNLQDGKLICNDCYTRLCTALSFVIDLKKSTELLNKHSQIARVKSKNETWPKPIQLDKNLNGEVIPQEKEIKQEVISDDDDVVSESQSEIPPMLEIKVEPEEILSQTLPIQITVNGTISLDEHEKISSSINGDAMYEQHLDANAIKEEHSSDEEGPVDMPLECMLCTKTCRTVRGLKAHVLAHHNYKGVKRKIDSSTSPMRSLSDSDGEHPQAPKRQRHICTTCMRVFTTTTDLKVHETCHNKFTCFACDGKFDSFLAVTEHRKTCSAQPSAVKPKTLDDAIRDRDQRQNRKSVDDKECGTKSGELLCKTCKVSFKDIFYLKLHNAIQHSKKNQGDTDKATETKNQNSQADIEMLDEYAQYIDGTAEHKKNEEKYNKIETELESIFEYAVEKNNSGSPSEKTVVKENETLQETLEGTNDKTEVEVPLDKPVIKTDQSLDTKEEAVVTQNLEDGLNAQQENETESGNSVKKITEIQTDVNMDIADNDEIIKDLQQEEKMEQNVEESEEIQENIELAEDSRENTIEEISKVGECDNSDSNTVEGDKKSNDAFNEQTEIFEQVSSLETKDLTENIK